MSEVPSISAKKAIKAFGKFGFEEVRRNGSHAVLKKDGHRFLLTIPVHGNKPLKRGLLRGQITTAGLTVEQFVEKL